ncbi:hypothetical protein M3J09_009182 [Ascochyta lentis]
MVLSFLASLAPLAFRRPILGGMPFRPRDPPRPAVIIVFWRGRD